MSTFFKAESPKDLGSDPSSASASDSDALSQKSRGKSSQAASEKGSQHERQENSSKEAVQDLNKEAQSASTDNVSASSNQSDNGDAQAPQDDQEYPSSWRLTLITIALCLCVFCVALDNTIIATAIPKITDQFNSLNDVGWYGSAYLLTTCSVTLMFGKLYTFYSTKWIYLLALSIFEVGSLVCGVTPSSIGLICGRAIAGLGAAGLFSGSILIISQSVPLAKRPMYTGLVGSMFGIASNGRRLYRPSDLAVVLLYQPTHRRNHLFFVLVFFKAPRAIKKKNDLPWQQQLAQFDLLGSIFFLPSVISLLLALQWGGTKYDWNDPRIIALFCVFGVGILIFVGIQYWGGDRATVPVRLIKNRNIWGAAWYALAIGAAFFVITYYLPIWFQAIKGATAMKSGIMNLPLIISVVVVSILAGGLVTACGYYTPFMLASSVIMTIGAGLLTTLETNSNHSKWIGYQALFGIGLGLGMQQPMLVAQTALKREDVPSGTAIVMFAQTLGGAVFVSVAQNVFQNQLVHNLREYAPEVDASRLLKVGATMIRTIVPGPFLHQVLSAYNDAVTQTFYVAVSMGALSLVGPIFIEWISVKGKKPEVVAV
ncbi:hypothetical protein N7510_005336 [Penicillium lagena]|uniref:uncharacterized protein n=1 Tax=Penicillium lagena TaxID=94218 RepID=UPI0025425126|nr:uncharacterized protein N7510_005336 [Penicillium lagena]KAJ5612142.1 hypothetical protein N7510_005336 [Penicillium lagena]